MRARIALLLVAVTLLGSCSKDDSADGDSLLRYIPADSPYVFTNPEPYDPALRKAWLSALGGSEMLVAANEMLASAERMADDEDDRKGVQLARKLLSELGPMFDPAVEAPMGTARAAEFAVYGYGLLPVIRIRLEDPAAFEAAIARMEEAVGEAMPLTDVGGHSMRRQVLEEMVLYLAVIGNQAVLALTPLSVDEQIRDELLGLRLPQASLADSPVLTDLVARYGLNPMAGVGYLDNTRLVGTLVAPQSVGDKALLDESDELEDEDKANEAVCQAEAAAIAAHFPRLVIGGTRLDAKSMDSLAVLELTPEWASQWAAISSPQAGADAPTDALVWFGFGLDPVKAGTLLGKIADRVIKEPYQCAQLADLNTSMAEMKEGLNPMVIGMAANFHGFFVSLDTLEMDEEGTPTGGSGVLALSSPTPGAVWSFAQGQVESLRALKLEVDGEPVALPADLVPYPLPVRALMTDRSLAVAIGDATDARARQVAAVSSTGPHPILRYGESGRFYSEFYARMFEQGLVDGMLDAAESDDDEGQDEDAQDGEDLAAEEDADGVDEESSRLSRAEAEALANQLSALMKRFGEALAHTEMRLLFSERGIEMQQEMRLR
jgi:hypothetical protein